MSSSTTDRQVLEAAEARIARWRAARPGPVLTEAKMLEFVPKNAPVELNPPECPDCQDRGYQIRQDGGAGAAQRCRCQIKTYSSPESIPAGDLEARGCPKTVAGKLKAGWNPALGKWPRIADFWPRRCERDGERPKWLLFHGAVGNGKSMAAAHVMRRAMATGAKCWWFDVPAAIERAGRAISGAAEDQLTLNTQMDKILSHQLLVMDEVGAHGHTDWKVLDLFYRWVAARHESGFWTVAVTNLGLEQLRSLHEPSASRICSGPTIELTGGDARRREWRIG